MNIEKVHPDLRKMVKRFPPFPLHNPAFRRALQFMSKKFPRPAKIAGVDISEQKLLNVTIRVYKPEQGSCGAALIWIHGGGMILGSATINDRECSAYAKHLKLTVISVDYRLAPQHQFPCALDDCFEVWQWLLRSASELGISPYRIVLAGQSAGAGLATSLAQKIQDLGGIQPAGLALFCAMLDDRTAANMELDAVNHFIWNNKNNRAGWSCYLGHPPGSGPVPKYAVPARHEVVSGLPPVWIGVSDIDLFFAENFAFARRLQEAGVPCELKIIEGIPHGFETLDTNFTKDFIESNWRFLTRVLDLH